jgi:4,5-dihydroxyphthalate decarboxylase
MPQNVLHHDHVKTVTAGLVSTDRVDSLCDGTVASPTLQVRTVTDEPENVFRKMLHDRAFDVAEMSLATYVIEFSRGKRDLVALPVFPSRMFRHSAVYVRRGSTIREPEDLVGRPVGVPDYQMTAAVWLRWAFAADHDVDWRAVRWFTGGLEKPAIGERIPFTPPADTHVEPVSSSTTLVEALLNGDLDALVSPKAPSGFTAGGPIRRLLTDFKNVELHHYERHHIVPIMHTLVVTRQLWEHDNWIASELINLFTEAKNNALERVLETDSLKMSLVWLPAYTAEQRAVFGDDPWVFGLEQNRAALATFTAACADQGLLAEEVEVDDLFPPLTASRNGP